MNVFRTTYGIRFDEETGEGTPYLMVTKTPVIWSIIEWFLSFICDMSEDAYHKAATASRRRQEVFEIAGVPKETVLRYSLWRGWGPLWSDDLFDEDDEYAL